MGEICINPPESILIGTGKGVSGCGAPDTHMVKFAALCSKTCDDILEAFAIDQLTASNEEELILTVAPVDFQLAR